MGASRIKGIDVEVRIVSDGELEATLTAIQSFEIEDQLEILSEGFLGEGSKRKDEIYNGVRGRFTMQSESQDYFTFNQKVIDRAKRRTPSVQFNIVATLLYPNGDTPRISIPDVSFGSMPFAFSDRQSYGTITVEFEAEDKDVLT